MSYDEICIRTNWSRSKLQRTIRSLLDLGLIEKKHRAYKRTTLKIAHASRQSEFTETAYESSVTQESHVSDDTIIGHRRNSDVSPMTHSILERELERKLESDQDDDPINEGFDPTGLIVSAFPALEGKLSKVR